MGCVQARRRPASLTERDNIYIGQVGFIAGAARPSPSQSCLSKIFVSCYFSREYDQENMIRIHNENSAHSEGTQQFSIHNQLIILSRSTKLSAR